jgi:CRP/FNR family cyclic AMP-dependent transcriptional regulator
VSDDVASAWRFELPAEATDELTHHAVRRRAVDGELIHARGDAPDGLYQVVRGKVRMSAVSGGGRELVLTILEPGSWFGEISLLDGLPRTHDAHAVGDTELLMVPRDRFDALLAQRPALVQHLFRLLCQRLRLAMTALEDAALLPLPARLAKRLLGAPVDDDGVALPQGELARMLGTSRQSVSKILKAWERQGWVSVAYGRVALVDAAALSALVEAADAGGDDEA